jgi:hypothetical protein
MALAAIVVKATDIPRFHLGTELRSILPHGSLAHGRYFIPKSDVERIPTQIEAPVIHRHVTRAPPV